jgi:uncharacterized protein
VVRSNPIFVLLALLLLITPEAPRADDSAALYSATVIVTGMREETRSDGIARAFGLVLAKLSGDPRITDDSRVREMTGEATDMVASFSYRDRMAGIPVHDEQGSYDRPYDLTVAFDRAKVDAALARLGRKPWLDPRPRLVVIVSVDIGGQHALLARDRGIHPTMIEALDAEAARFAMPIVLPSSRELAAARIDARTSASMDALGLKSVAKMTSADGTISGTLRWSEAALGWIAEWSLVLGGNAYGWSVRGVSFDQAFRNAIAGAMQIAAGNGNP